MKKLFILFLCLLFPLSIGASELKQISAGSLCYMKTGHIQENRICNSWKKVLTKEKRLVPTDGESSYLFYIVAVIYDEDAKKIFVSYVATWKLVELGGLSLMVWSDVETYDLVNACPDQKKKVNDSLRAFDNWVPTAASIFRNICPPCTDYDYKPKTVRKGDSNADFQG